MDRFNPRNHPLLARDPLRDRPSVELGPDMPLALARVHECCGMARHTFGIWAASRMKGPVMWIVPHHSRNQLNPDGMAPFVQPGRFYFVTPRRTKDLLWCMEEALRSGAVPLVVADLPAPPPLTPIRRLQLAAETGAREGEHIPLGLVLTPGAGGAPGVETRWQFDHAHDGATRKWKLTRLRARTAPVKSWPIGLVEGLFAPLMSEAIAQGG